MRILVVTQYFWPETFRINEIVEHLARIGHDVTVLTGLPNYPAGSIFPEYQEDPQRFASYHGARIERVPLVPRGNSKIRLLLNYLSFAASGAVVGAWRLRRKPFDVILVFQASPVTAAIPAFWQRYAKSAPIVMWIVDLWPETLTAIGAVKSDRALSWIGRLVSSIYARCDCILVQSKAFFPNIRRYGGDLVNVRYFPAWAEGVFEGEAREIEDAPELAPYRDTFNVMFAGNIGEAQDFPAILAAADRIRARKDIRWLVLGDGRAAEVVRAEIAARGLTDRVILLGRFPMERMPSFFKAADALLVSLKPEPVFAMTIPGKVQSYLSAGRPLLAMLDGEGARVIAESGAGFVAAAGNSEALAHAVVKLADMTPGARAAMGAAGRAYCKRHFDRADLFACLENWLAEEVEKRRKVKKPA